MQTMNRTSCDVHVPHTSKDDLFCCYFQLLPITMLLAPFLLNFHVNFLLMAHGWLVVYHMPMG